MNRSFLATLVLGIFVASAPAAKHPNCDLEECYSAVLDLVLLFDGNQIDHVSRAFRNKRECERERKRLLVTMELDRIQGFRGELIATCSAVSRVSIGRRGPSQTRQPAVHRSAPRGGDPLAPPANVRSGYACAPNPLSGAPSPPHS